MTDPALVAAARLLGMPVKEIAAVEDSPAGTIITTTDGTRMIDVPEHTPDGAGRHGLMLLIKPDPERIYTCPVYTSPSDGGDELRDEVSVDEDPAAVIGALLARITELEEGADEVQRARIVELEARVADLEQELAAAAAAADDDETPASDSDEEMPEHHAAVVKWVGTDRARAARAWEVERNREGGPRPSVTEVLEPLLDDTPQR